MKQFFQFLMFTLIFSVKLQAQVGIGNTDPKATLDITIGDLNNPLNTDGILVPRVNTLNTIDPDGDQDGMLVYLTRDITISTVLYSKGFYYWDWNITTGNWMSIAGAVDNDWYEVGTTNPPNDNIDDMFHLGNVGIGQNSANYKLDIYTDSDTRAINTEISGNTTGTIYGQYIQNDNSEDGDHYGIYSIVNGLGEGDHYGMSNRLSGFGDGTKYGIDNIISNGDGTHYGVRNSLSSSDDGIHYGIRNDLTSSGDSRQYGVYNYISSNSTRDRTGVYNSLRLTSNSNSADAYGIQNDFNGISGSPSNGDFYGLQNDYNGYGDSDFYGIVNDVGGSPSLIGDGDRQGMYNYFNGDGDGIRYGINNAFSGDGNGSHYGSRSNLDGTGAGTKYGTYNQISPSAGGAHYAVYGSALKAGSNVYAGYFLGQFAIGTAVADTYKMPASRGAVNQIMVVTDGTGQVNFVDASTVFTSTDNQNISGSGLSGTDLTIGIQNGTSEIIDLSSLQGTERINDLFDGKSDFDGSENFSSLFLGFNAGLNDNSSDNKNIGIGFNAINVNTTGEENTAIGYRALETNSGASQNTALGYYALRGVNVSGSSGNTAIGHSAMGNTFTNTFVAESNVAIGASALESNVAGDFNVAIGRNAMATNSLASKNVAIGYGALSVYGASAGQNTAIGYNAMSSYISNEWAVAIGAESMENATHCDNCTAIGNRTLRANTSGIQNVALGERSLEDNTTGNANVALGSYTLRANTSGTKNIAIGNFAGAYGNGSNKLIIDTYDSFADANVNGDSPLIYGEFDNDILRVNGEFQIGNPIGTGYTFPVTAGSVNQILTTDVSGDLNFVDVSTIFIDTNTDEQTIENFSFNTSTNQLSLEIENDGLPAQTVNLSTLANTNTQNTLDQAYDEGGAGAGRTINVDNGAVVIEGNAGGLTATTSAQLILIETTENDFSRLRFKNSVDTNNTWTIGARTDNTASLSRMNFNHNGIGDVFQLWGDGVVEVNGTMEINGQTGISGVPNATLHAYHTNTAGTDGFKIQNQGANNNWWRMFTSNNDGRLYLYSTLGGASTRGNFNNNSGVYSATSDRRLKKDFKPLRFSWETFMNLKTLSYLYKSQKDDTRSLGLIAQDVNLIYPELVSYNNKEDIYHMNYSGFGVIAVKAVQELKNEVDTLKTENAILKAKLNKLETLEARLTALEYKTETSQATELASKED